MKTALKTIHAINEAMGESREADLKKALANIDKQFGGKNKPEPKVEFEPLIYSDGKKSPAVDVMSAHKELKHLETALDQFSNMNKKGETSFRTKIIKKTEAKLEELKAFIEKNGWDK